jgi:pimeloyl-ACP methyl ester carboxylesterase
MDAAEDVRHRPEGFATVGDIDLCYDVLGDPDRPTMLLIMGLGFQLVHWPEDFCRRLAGEGLRVVRFDNRDAGRSTHLPGSCYTLDDMADDAVGLLDALGVGSAHVVGASLGGMVAQTLAIRHPHRVRSLASLMSTTGQRGVGRISWRVFRHLLGRSPRTELRRTTAEAYRRDPESRSGRRRQHRAVRAAPDRTPALRRLGVPAVVIHGTEDRMCHPSGGRATAEAIPGARLVLVRGMGHDLPRGAWPQLVDAITSTARRAEESPGTRRSGQAASAP